MNNTLTTDLDLASKGLNVLINEGIANHEKEIMEIFTEFSELKEASYNSKSFQKKVFQSLKEKHLSINKNDNDDYYKHLQDIDWMTEYTQIYPFLQKYFLSDAEIQGMLEGKIRFELQSLAEVARKYGDDECSKYTSDRIGSLISLEEIYTITPSVVKDKEQHIKGFLHVLSEWTECRVGGVWFPRVLSLVKKSGASDSDIADAVFIGWEKSEFSPKITDLKEFPENTLKDIEVEKNITENFKHMLGTSNIGNIISHYESYPFLKDTCKEYNTLLEEKGYGDEEVNATIGRCLKWSLSESLKRAYIERINVILQYFPSAIKYLPREEFFKYLLGGLHDRSGSEWERRTKILEAFPLSQDEAETFVLGYLNYNIKNCGMTAEYFTQTMKKLLGLFPGMNFDKVVKREEIKAYISHFIPGQKNKEDEIYLINLIGIMEDESKAETETIYVESFKKSLQYAVNPHNNARSVEIKKLLRTLQDSACNKEKVKEMLQDEEIKSLVHKFVQSKIPDWNRSFTDSFGNDAAIDELCKNDLFPLTREEVDTDINEVLTRYCKRGHDSGIAHFQKCYAIVDEKIKNNDEVVIENVIEGITQLLTSLKTSSDISNAGYTIKSLFRILPILETKRQDDSIQSILDEKKNIFLSAGDMEGYKRMKQYKEGNLVNN